MVNYNESASNYSKNIISSDTDTSKHDTTYLNVSSH